jgi:predicted transposase YdaD
MGQYDAALKHTLSMFPADWAHFLGVPQGIRVEAVDVDLSSVSQMADKLLRVHANPAYLLHIEPHSYSDEEFDTRMLQYQATARHREQLDVHSVALLLYPRAWGPKNKGGVQAAAHFPGCRLDFAYQIIRVWELPPETLLQAGVGVLPLAPLANVTAEQLPEVVNLMSQRLSAEVPRADAMELWTAAHILMGIKYGRQMTNLILRSVREQMRDSPTYLEILEEGEEKGIEKGTILSMQTTLLRQGERRFGPPAEAIRQQILANRDRDLLDGLLLRVLDVSNWDDLMRDAASADS